jgi:alpha/beta superfamily hydrolase
MGWLAVRPNFRGVGKTAGTHDEGRGETDDFLHVIDTLPRALSITAPPLRALAGFSFGSFVAARAVQLLAARNEAPQHVVLVGAAAGKWPLPTVPDACRFGSLIVHGEYDETIPLAHVLDWARPQDLPIVVLPGADHFFHRRLSILKRLIVQHVTAGTATEAIDAVGQND